MNKAIAAKWGKRLGGLCLACVILLMLLPAAAEAAETAPVGSEATGVAAEVSGSASEAPSSPAPKEPDLASEAAVLIDAKTGIQLFGKRADSRHYPASITKIVTGIIALETTDPDEIVTVPKEARYEDGTRIYLAEGEQVSMRNLLYGLLMNSGNDAATAIADYIDGSKEKFADRMNEFVKETVGVGNSHFTNPSGLPDPDHYTTAADMAQIARYAMQNEMFRKIVSTKTMPWNGEEWQSELVNHNKMLWSYEGATGIKNGYTEAAGNTLVVSAARGDMDLIGVVLKAPSSAAADEDMAKLLDYGFDAFAMKVLVTSGQTFASEEDGDEVEWRAAEPLVAAVPKSGSAPRVVARQGQAYIETPLGQQLIGPLEEVSRQPLITAPPPSPAAAEPLEEVRKPAISANSGILAGVAMPVLGVVVLAAIWSGYRSKKRRERL